MASLDALYSIELQEQKFIELVALIVQQKTQGTYKDIVPEVVGGWFVEYEAQQIQKAERIADAVVEILGKE